MKVPAGKRVLNVHIADEEHAFVTAEAGREKVSLTMLVRLWIRERMRRAAPAPAVKE